MYSNRRKWISVRTVATTFGVIGLCIGIARGIADGNTFFQATIAFFINASTELFGIAITALVIDWLNKRSEDEYQKERLIREMSSKDHEIVLRAVVDLAARGWLKDGSLDSSILIESNFVSMNLNEVRLRKARLERANMEGCSLGGTDLQGANLTGANLKNSFLQEANFQNANLWKADLSSAVLERVNFENASLWQANLQEAYLSGCNFKGADLRSANLSGTKNVEIHQFRLAHELCGATMPNDDRYNGKLNLTGDLEKAKSRGLNLDHPEDMADYYGVSVIDYVSGQSENEV